MTGAAEVVVQQLHVQVPASVDQDEEDSTTFRSRHAERCTERRTGGAVPRADCYTCRRMNFSRIMAHITRAISSPSMSTTGLATGILSWLAVR